MSGHISAAHIFVVALLSKVTFTRQFDVIGWWCGNMLCENNNTTDVRTTILYIYSLAKTNVYCAQHMG